jgi:hypothetical protein
MQLLYVPIVIGKSILANKQLSCPLGLGFIRIINLLQWFEKFMKHIILLFILIAPTFSHACEWKVVVKDRETNELKYYLADSSERTEFPVKIKDGEIFAACHASVSMEKIEDEHKKRLEKAETGVLLCAYTEALSYPIAASASRFVYTDGTSQANPVIMTLLSVPDKGKKLKSLFTIRYACR